MAQSSPQYQPSPSIFLEVLEPRVAPAVLVIGTPENEEGAATGAQAYRTDGTPFKSADGAFAGLTFSAHHYYLDLARGDTVNVVGLQNNTLDFIKLSQGSAFAFFFDRNLDGIPTVDELTGLSLSGGTVITVKGDIDGDVVANRNGAGGSLIADSLISSQQTIAGLTADSVGTGSGNNGKIIAGGNLANIRVENVKVIQSGTPDYGEPDRLNYNFGGTGAKAGIGVGVLQPFDPAPRGAGGSLTNITVTAADYILAGDGGAGGKGGNIANVLVVADADGILIRAGDGGSDTRGGAGGSVSQVVFQGVKGGENNAPLQVVAGAGGDGGATGTGGTGGKLSNVWIGYQYADASRKTLAESADPVRNNIFLGGGAGGAGASAGAGGAVSGVSVFAATPDRAGVPYEIEVVGGDGGQLPDFGAKKAGAGGSVTNFKIKNFNTALDPSDVRVAGGDASVTVSGGLASGTGANGGGVSNPAAKANEEWLVGASFRVEGGDGSNSASRGGAGGAVNGLYFQPFSSLYLRQLEVEGGAGGQSATGAGGAGGALSRIYVPISDFNGNALVLRGGDGGASSGGAGGAGGAITRVDIFDVDTRINPLPAAAVVHAGAGGQGLRSGGVGGSIAQFSFFSTAAGLDLAAGDGGQAALAATAGKGGDGGSITAVAFVTSRGLLAQGATLNAGDGGDGRGSGAGGKGGGASRINVQAAGAVAVSAGDGGDGSRGGVGGSLGGSANTAGLALASRLAHAEATAGAGGNGPSGGAGGSIINAVLSARTDVAVRAGDGSFGAAGGGLSRIGFFGSAGASSSPDGNVDLRAGDGGAAFAANGRAGVGGSVQQVSGFTSDNARNLSGTPSDWNYVKVQAGQGGSNGSRGGVGGSVNGLNLLGGLAPFLVSAGHGGDGVSGGGAGGNILNVSSAVRGIALALAAGDGGDAPAGRAGGVGGSVDRVNVLGDIGLRAGAVYGYQDDPALLGTRMGGIFAGKGGDGAAGVMAAAGKVTNVTAQAISAIVAGREASPYLVSLVDRIYLNGNEELKRVGDTLPAIVQGTSVFAGSGGAGAAPGANVIGNGSSLAVTGDYNGGLGFNLQTAGGNFSGVTVLYIDTDGQESGILSTGPRDLRLIYEYDADFTLKASVVGVAYNTIPPIAPVPPPPPGIAYRSILDFDAGFRPEFALAVDADQWVLYDLTISTPATLPTPVPLASGAVTAVGGSYRFALDYSDLGLSAKLAVPINFVATYLAGLNEIPQQPLPQQIGAYRTDQAIGFSIGGGDPGSASVLNPPTPETRVTSYASFTQQLANFVGGKAGSPLAAGAVNFAYAGGAFTPSATEARSWDYGAGGTRPLDGLIAAAVMTDKRNFTPLAFLTDASGGTARLWVPTILAA